MYTQIPNKEAESGVPLKPLNIPTTGRSTLVLVLVLFIVTLGIISTLSIYLFPNTTDRLSALLITLFGREERIEMTSDKQNVITKEVFTLFYNHIGREGKGDYVLTYPCSENINLSFATISGTSTETSAITCDEKISIAPKTGEKTGSISLASISSSTTISEVLITIAFLPEGTSTPSVKGILTINVENIDPANSLSTDTPDISNTNPNSLNPQEIGQPIKKPATSEIKSTTTINTPAKEEILTGPITTNSYQLSSNPQVQKGRPDLAVRIIETGTVDKNTGEFTATSSFKSSDRIAVKFEVRNDGGREVNSWYFNAVLPSFPSHIFTSPGQPPLIPGARIEFTLGFDNVNMSTGAIREFVVNADPASSIGEESEINNIAKIIIADVTP